MWEIVMLYPIKSSNELDVMEPASRRPNDNDDREKGYSGIQAATGSLGADVMTNRLKRIVYEPQNLETYDYLQCFFL